MYRFYLRNTFKLRKENNNKKIKHHPQIFPQMVVPTFLFWLENCSASSTTPSSAVNCIIPKFRFGILLQKSKIN
jgi:hypothetical protein